MAGQHPSRTQAQRFFVSGQVPDSGLPGSFAVNIPDRKAWTFNEAGHPVLFASTLREHSDARTYAPQDLAFIGTALYRARTMVAPSPFNPAQWDLITGISEVPPIDPAATGLLTGGVLSTSGGNIITVTPGTGVIVDASMPAAQSRSNVAWGVLNGAIAGAGQTVRVILINSSGLLTSAAINQYPTVRRTHIVLGFAVFNDVGNLVDLWNAPRVAAQTSQDVADLIGSLGGPFIINGCRIIPGTGLSINVTAGSVFALHGRWRSNPAAPNRVPFSAVSPVSLDVIRASGEPIASDVTSIPTGFNETGAVAPGLAVIHYLFASTSGNHFWLQLGQGTYSALPIAETNLRENWRDFVPAFPPDAGAVFLGALIVLSGAASLADPQQARIVPVMPGMRINARFDSSGMGDEFMRLDGASTMFGPLDMGNNPILNAIIDEGTF